MAVARMKPTGQPLRAGPVGTTLATVPANGLRRSGKLHRGTRRPSKNRVFMKTASHRCQNLRDSGPIRTESRRRIDALLAAYAAGTLSEPFAVLVAAHLQMKADDWAHAVPLRNHQQ